MMNDIKEAYYEDMQEKNRLAQSGRLAGFKVHPSLDQKKVEKAEVSAMNLNEPMYYSDFNAPRLTDISQSITICTPLLRELYAVWSLSRTASASER